MTTSATSALTQRDLVRARLKNVRAWLNTVLRRLTPDVLDYAPAEGMRTVRGQLEEMLWVEIPMVPYLKEGRQLSGEETDALIGQDQSLESLLQKLTDVRQLTLDYLESLSDEELAEAAPEGDTWFGTMWIPNMPKAEHFRNIAEHEYYHVGQLITYLWCKGDEWEPSWFQQA